MQPSCRGKLFHILSVCAALGIQHAERMSHTILPSVASPVLPYFYTLHHKRHDFRGKLLNIKCVF